MDKKKMIDRVKKLLSLANSDNEHEAKLAAERASKLLTEYNLTMQEVVVNRDYESTTVVEKNRMAQEDKWLMPLLRDFFFVNPIIHSSYRGRDDRGRRKYAHSIVFIGEDVNVEVASYVYEFLLKEYRILWKVYSKRTGAKRGSKDSYYHGLTWGLKAQLQRSQKAVQNETGLVLVKDPGLEKYMNEQHPDLRSQTRKANVGDFVAASHGAEDGKNIQIRKGVGSSQNQGAVLAIGG